MIIGDSSTLPMPIDGGAGRVTTLDQLAAISEKPRRIADTAEHAPKQDKRVLWTKKRSIGLRRSVRKEAGVARVETKHIIHLMRKFHLSNEEIVRASPALRRNLTHGLFIKNRIAMLLFPIYMFLYAAPPLLFGLLLNMPSRVSIVQNLSSMMISIVLPITIKFFPNDDAKRNMKYGASRFGSFYIKKWWRWWWSWWCFYLPWVAFFLWLNFNNIIGGSQVEFIFAGFEVILLVMYFSLIFKTQKLILRWRAPDLVLVRALADAFTTVAEGGPAVWRSIAGREKAAAYVSEAANVIDGPIARKFVRSAGHLAAGARLLSASAALRQKITWLATPQPETREFLARALARELLIAATGDLDRLESAEITGSLPASRLRRFGAIVSWAVLFSPAVFLVIAKSGWWHLDDTTTSIVSQIAAFCVSVAIVSGIGSNDNKEKLDSIISWVGHSLVGKR
jgi:hypothetical protein